MTGHRESISVLALMCPESRSPDEVPVIIGTNASMFKQLAQLCKETAGVDLTHTLQIHPCDPQGKTLQTGTTEKTTDDAIGVVMWLGPGPLIIPSQNVHYATCKVKENQPLGKDILLVDQLSISLPAGVLVQPVVLPASAVDVNKFSVLFCNESWKEPSIPVGPVIAHLYHNVTVAQKEHEERFLKVLSRLEESGLTMSIDKCQLCQPVNQSRKLSSSERHYLVHQLESLALKWAVRRVKTGKRFPLALWKQAEAQESPEVSSRCADQLGVSPEAIPECYAFPTRLELGCLEQLSRSDLLKAQASDANIAPVRQAIQEGKLASVQCKNPGIALLQREGTT
ncbi:hypothetical protein SKAU_G00212380 [Synaphobranchus kaupii]|uniref:Uncharacterized protein n=1 Tax=Synaphobranchus kaupii TaxID=118154 RepID=A0A9Q1IV20_SYNKA|nr:hypothetical protein SKAU_G00212380 [Synaphobranchus kaupii]